MTSFLEARTVAFKSRCGQGGLGIGGPPPDSEIFMNNVQNHDLIDLVDTADAKDEFYLHGKFSEPRLPSLCVNHCLKPVFHTVQTTVDDMTRDKVPGNREIADHEVNLPGLGWFRI